MLARNRKVLLLLILAIVAGLAVFAPALEQPADSPPAARAARTTKSLDSTASVRTAGKGVDLPSLSSELPGRATLGEPKADPFGPQSWQPPPPKVVVSPPVPPPPPPLHYRFVGRLLQDGNLQVFVSKGDTPIAIKVGDTLEGGYVVESITADGIALIYPPLAHRTRIAIPPIMTDAGSTAPAKTVTPPNALGSLPAQAVVNRPAPSAQTPRDIAVPSTPAAKPK